jgi:hypothetical protein
MPLGCQTLPESSSAALLASELELAVAFTPDVALATSELIIGSDEADGAMEADGDVVSVRPRNRNLGCRGPNSARPERSHPPEKNEAGTLVPSVGSERSLPKAIKALDIQDVAFSKSRGLAFADMVKSTWVYRTLKRFRAGIEASSPSQTMLWLGPPHLAFSRVLQGVHLDIRSRSKPPRARTPRLTLSAIPSGLLPPLLPPT